MTAVRSVLLAAALVGTIAPAADAQEPLHQARSRNGRYVLLLKPNDPESGRRIACQARLLERSDGEQPQRELWSGALINEVAPEVVCISDDGRFVVTLGEFKRGGARHAVVVYDERGTQVRSFSIRKLLVAKDWKHVRVEDGRIEWLRGARFRFDREKPHFLIRLRWGRTITIDLARREIVRPPGFNEHDDAANLAAVPAEALDALGISASEQTVEGEEARERQLAVLKRAVEDALSAVPVVAGPDTEVVDLEKLRGAVSRLAKQVEVWGVAPSQEQLDELSAMLTQAYSELGKRGASPKLSTVVSEDEYNQLMRDASAGNSFDAGMPIPRSNPAERVDYVAWMNERTYTEGENAGPLYRAAQEGFVPWPEEEVGVGDSLHSLAMMGDPEALASEEVLNWLDANQQVMDDFRAATDYEFRGFERESNDGTLLGILLPDLSTTRSIAKMLAIEGKRLEADGEGDEAMGVYADMVAAGHHQSQGGTLIEGLVGVAIQALGSRSLLDAFDGPVAEGIDYAALAESLEQRYRPARPLAETIQGERAMALDVLQRVYRYDADAGHYEVDPDGLHTMSQALGNGDNVAAEIALGMMLGSRGYEELAEQVNARYDEMTEAFTAPYPDGREQMERLDRAHAGPTDLVPFSGGGGDPLLSQILPAFGRAHIVMTRAEARRRATLLTTNIMAYRQEHGVLPDSLDAFGDREFLIDPFTDAAFAYRRDGDGFVLYSLGENGADDGGTIPGEGYDAADLVYWPRGERR